MQKLFKLAAKFAQQISQQDLGTGETQVLLKAIGQQIKSLLSPLSHNAKQLTFTCVVQAPNFVARQVTLEGIDVYAGDDPGTSKMAEAVAQQIMNKLKTRIEQTLLAFYLTPAGRRILKVSGTPPTMRTVIKLNTDLLS